MERRGEMSRRKALAGIHLATLLFGFSGLFSRWVKLPSIAIVAGRTLFASLFLLVFLPLTGHSLRVREKKYFIAFAATGGLLALHWFSFFRSIQLSTVALGLLSFSCFPVFLVFLEPLLFREKFRPQNLLMAAVMFPGVYLIAPTRGRFFFFSPGLLWGLLSGLTFALLILANRGLARRYSGLFIAFWQDFFAFLSLLPFLFLAPVRLTVTDIGKLFLLGIFCTAIAHALFIHGMKKIKGQTAGWIAMAEPVYAILLAFLLFGETPGLRILLGGFLIVGAAVWATAHPD